ncbi:chemotaxis protein CheW [Shewanella livingstonensis]|uniref:Chemotaxis protein CheW n=1 Tax=Shewanella livingstonensis TaxID=150120 RepID=A0A3G8LSD0_9GAMM|nr:chemotaxis protein CheW [Shewanella livingstonensis]AZG72683.1 chemotaxis protein CheW [Shewanella livingstonensis]
MSKSVDETVFDYFSLLLQEPPKSIPEQSLEVKQAISVTPVNDIANKTSNISEDKTTATDASAIPISTHYSQQILPKVSSPITSQWQYAPPTTNVDKMALEKLLSAVSKPNAETDLSQQIKASAERVRQAITHIEPKTAVNDTKTPEIVLTDKEINPLVDINNNESSHADIKDAIIKHDQLVQLSSAHEHTTPDTQAGYQPPSITHDLQEVLDDEFQVLFFNVAGLTLAVPLVSLGGIIKIDKINHLIGRPSWFKGVQTHRDSKINVVDTCAWVMPEKYSPELAQTVNYQYIVMLEDSQWGLTCESLVNAVKIDKSHVNWREKPGKRPWLAGVVKQQMCGILHVQALIKMLDAGLGCQDSIDRG